MPHQLLVWLDTLLARLADRYVGKLTEDYLRFAAA